MKVLYYNWVDYLDPEKRGGGVSVYQKNLMDEMAKSDDVEAWFLSSGISYDLFDLRPRWEAMRHGPSAKDRRYELINSGALAPGHHSFGHEAQVDHPETRDAFFDFLRRNGPFDIVHFNNLEGLPASVLTLKEQFPDTRVVFSLHNYFPICPQVNLWHQERENCTDYDNGKKCENCLTAHHDAHVIRTANAVAYRLKRTGVTPGKRGFDRLFGYGVRASLSAMNDGAKFSKQLSTAAGFSESVRNAGLQGGALKPVEPMHRRFRRRREAVVKLMNTHCDRILCVSNRVATVAAKFGIQKKLLQTAYIGTRQSQKYAETQAKESLLDEEKRLTLCYMGYMRRDKGFFFLLDALEALPEKTAARINLILCARRADDHTMHRIEMLGGRFNQVLWADGYSHDQLDELLADVNVGIVPVLWEDNLPQVAIEMHARHIPLLTSNLGGASELGNFPPMTFEAGDIDSFHGRLAQLLAGRIKARDYWKNARAPLSMAEHMATLTEVYEELIPQHDAVSDKQEPEEIPAVVASQDASDKSVQRAQG